MPDINIYGIYISKNSHVARRTLTRLIVAPFTWCVVAMTTKISTHVIVIESLQAVLKTMSSRLISSLHSKAFNVSFDATYEQIRTV